MNETNTAFLPVAAAYDRWSRIYDTYENPMVFLAAEVLRLGLGKRVAGKSVFEFGCGTGRNLAALAAASAGRIAGCDLSDGMLGIARSERRLGDAVFRHDFMQDLPSGIGEFDCALFSLTLEHAERLDIPLRQAKRILKPRGEIRILEIHPFLSLDGVAAHFHEEGTAVRMPTYPHQFAAWLNAFAETGLRVFECREWRPSDLGVPPALSGTKRGPEFPMLVEFGATRP